MSHDHAGNDDDAGNVDPKNARRDGEAPPRSSSTAASSTSESSGGDGGGADTASPDRSLATASHDAHESADPERPEPEPEHDVDRQDADDDADDNFRKRKVLFGDCALVEIIHLHDCLRGALRTLHHDVTELARTAAAAASSSSLSAGAAGVLDGRREATSSGGGSCGKVEACHELAELERRVAARFKVIWSVFRAHSAAEDEFIWPALTSKITLPPSRQHRDRDRHAQSPPLNHRRQQDQGQGLEGQQSPVRAAAAAAQEQNNEGGHHHPLIEPEEYEEDHADEERMFLEMDNLLSKLRVGLQSPHGGGGNGSPGARDSASASASASSGALEERVERGTASPIAPPEEQLSATGSPPSTAAGDGLQLRRRRREQRCCCTAAVSAVTTEIQAMSKTLSHHLLQHLEKEEDECMPLVLEHLTKSEITDLVGKIMGKRSSDLMSQILTMAIQTLPEAEREDMVGYMRQAMVGTFFERWLAMEGFWSLSKSPKTRKSKRVVAATATATAPGSASGTHDKDDEEAGDQKMSPGEAQAAAGADRSGTDGSRDPSATDPAGQAVPMATSAAAAAAAAADADSTDGGIERDTDAFSSALPIVADACRRTYDRGGAAELDAEGRDGGDRRRRSPRPAAPPPPFACAAASAAGGSSGTATTQSKTPSTVPCCTVCVEAGRCLLRGVGGGDSIGGVDRTVSREELEKLIRSIGSNPGLTAVQKSTTIQGLRDSVWESNRRRSNSVGADGGGRSDGGGGGAKRKHDGSTDGDGAAPAARHCCIDGEAVARPITTHQAVPPSTCAARRGTAPSSYYKKDDGSGKVRLVWSSESPSMKVPTDQSIPLFSASELAPTYHDGATAAVLGCPHYARSCKLRHPSSGRLYTCRLCCEQEREMPLKVQDSPLDRYSVSEVLCMHCGALQPANDHCVNPKCDARGRPFAKYTCKICNLYDDGSHKRIYHCPFCNVCRAGSGLGIDFRHCMRCNACVSLGADGDHVCIPQRLQGNCPICHETMFESTEPLKGLKCGHVMHLKCFTLYRRAVYTCPLCKKSVEDMKEYFSMMDAAVRMQPMPAVYSHISSKIYCQDCCKTGKVQYHFVGCKCKHCGSYNTREIERCAEAS